MIRSISTQELAEHLEDADFVVVDVREMAAFNGWTLDGEARGGHISGAVAFPLRWLAGASAPVIKRRLVDKGVTPDKTVVVYATRREPSAAMAAMLEALAYPRVLTYDAGLAEWAADAALRMDYLPHYDKLVHPAWLHQTILGKGPPSTARDKSCLLFEVSTADAAAYHTGHIPGAVPFSTSAVESGPLWNRRCDTALEEALAAHGIAQDSTLVLYSRDTTAAARVAALLLYAGVNGVHVLDGGLKAWLAAGYPIEILPRQAMPTQSFGRMRPNHHHYVINAEEAHAVLADESAALVSIRSWSEYIGATSGYAYIQSRGRIAGDIWGYAGSVPRCMDHYRNVDNTMRSYHEIAANWRLQGITPDKRVAFYCGTGWRASEAFFYAYLMGWTQIAVYDGGWLEWSQRSTYPVATGEPPWPWSDREVRRSILPTTRDYSLTGKRSIAGSYRQCKCIGCN
jgi:thiosulfate/3-mercaptopyruvate sulfurtransferase